MIGSFSGADLPVLRAAVRAQVQAWQPGEAAEDFVLAVNEVATNAVVHGGGTGTLSLWHNRDQLVCRIADNGPGMPDPCAGTDPPRRCAASGYGLWLARKLSSVLLIDTSPAGTIVHLRLSRSWA